MTFQHLSRLTHSLEIFRHVYSSSWIHGAGLVGDRLLVLFEYPNGIYRSYRYLRHGVGSYAILLKAFSVGRAFRELDLKHHLADRQEGSLCFDRPFQVFEVNESFHDSLSVDVDVKVKLRQEGNFHTYYTVAKITGECDYKYFTEEYHGRCRYDIGVYTLDEVLTEFSLTPAPAGLGDNFKDKITVFDGELYGDIEVQVLRVAFI